MSGVELLAVPDPAVTPWVPVGPSPPGAPGVPGAPAYPLPVVNGQWIKGVGGAAVWSPIADTDVPAVASGGRLGSTGLLIADCNTVLNNGWYYANSGSVANAPPGSDYFSLFVVQMNGPGNVRQIAYAYSTDTVWMRRYKDATTWSPWQTRNAGPMVTALVAGDGTLLAGSPFGVSSGRWPGQPAGLYYVNFTVTIGGAIPLATNQTNIVACSATMSGPNQVQVSTGTNGVAYMDCMFSLVIFDVNRTF